MAAKSPCYLKGGKGEEEGGWETKEVGEMAGRQGRKNKRREEEREKNWNEKREVVRRKRMATKETQTELNE